MEIGRWREENEGRGGELERRRGRKRFNRCAKIGRNLLK